MPDPATGTRSTTFPDPSTTRKFVAMPSYMSTRKYERSATALLSTAQRTYVGDPSGSSVDTGFVIVAEGVGVAGFVSVGEAEHAATQTATTNATARRDLVMPK